MPGAHVSWEEQPQIGWLSKELRAVVSVHSGVRSPRRVTGVGGPGDPGMWDRLARPVLGKREEERVFLRPEHCWDLRA